MAAMAVLSIRSGQMARSLRSGLRVADFILPRIRSFIKGWQSDWPFYQGQPQWPFYQAALSRPGQWPQWPFYHQEAATWPDLRFPIAPHKQFISGHAEPFLGRAWQLYQGPPAAMAVLSKPMAGRFITKKRPRGQISGFGLRMAAFLLSPYKQFINGRVEPFLEKAGEASVRFIRPASRSGRFIKAEDQASGRDGRFINQERPHL